MIIQANRGGTGLDPRVAGFPDHGMTRASAAMMEQETIAAIRGLEGAARKRPQSPMAPPDENPL